MLSIDKIKNGLVIDHIRAGMGFRVFQWLGLGKADFAVAFIVNAPSKHMGRKDMIKIDEEIAVDYAVLGLIDPNITVNVIENERITEKIRLSLPERVVDVLSCKNPRCITQTEKSAPRVFHLEDPERGLYRCEYCDETQSAEAFR